MFYVSFYAFFCLLSYPVITLFVPLFFQALETVWTVVCLK